MATIYNPTIDEQPQPDPNRMFPAPTADPGFFDRMSSGVRMDFPNASAQGVGESLSSGFKATPQGQGVAAGLALANAVANLPDSRQPYPMTYSGGGSGSVPQRPAQAKNPADVLPPLPGPKPRNYLAEVEAKDRMFNAERDTPQPTAIQAAWKPPSRGDSTPQAAPRVYRPGETYSFSNTGAPGSTNMNMQMNPDEALRIAANQHENKANNDWISQQAGNTPRPLTNPGVDPGRLYGELVKRGTSHGDMTTANDYEKTLLAQVHAMLPGASPKEVRSVMTTINQAVRNPNAMGPTQPAQPGAGPGSLSQAVAKAQQPAPNYQKLGAGQSIVEMMPDGTARHITTAPGGAAEQHKNDQFKESQKNSMKLYEDHRKEYNKNWDKITQEITDPTQKDRALRELNTNHFKSMGIPDEIAQVPESSTLFLQDKLQPPKPMPWEEAPKNAPPLKTKLTRAEAEAGLKEHKNLLRIRNILANRFYNNTLQFEGPGGTR